MSETTKHGGGDSVLSLDGKAVGALASTGAGSTPATEYPHLFVRGSEYAHKGGFWCYREEDDEGDAPSRWIACDMLTADLLYKLASVEMAASDLVLSHDKAHKHNKELLDALAAAQREVEDLQEKLQAERHGNSYIRRALGIKKSEVLLVGVNRIAGEIAAAQRENAKLREVVLWALGERDAFPMWDGYGDDRTRYPADGQSPRIGYFWWRTELRRRFDAALRGEGEG